MEAALKIEKVDVDSYLAGKDYLWKPSYGRGVFGGQVVAQALHAAQMTLPSHTPGPRKSSETQDGRTSSVVPAEFSVNSLHSYFLRAADNRIPISYRVHRKRTGKSFLSRTVRAYQNGVLVFLMLCSFQAQQQFHGALDHQIDWQNGGPADPLSLSSEVLPFSSSSDSNEESGWTKSSSDQSKGEISDIDLPIEVRRTIPALDGLMDSEKQLEPRQQFWFRSKQPLGHRDLAFHQCVAAYASDHLILSTSMIGYGMTKIGRILNQAASLDHSIWFHAPFRADEWLLVDMQSPRGNNHRSLTLGKIYTRDGRLVVSFAQEGLLRTRDPGSIKTKL